MWTDFYHNKHSREQNWRYETSIYRKLAIILSSIAGGIIFYHIGKSESEELDLTKPQIIEFESETQIFHSLTVKKKPVFLYFFSPGYKTPMELHEGAERAALEHGDDVDFIRVNCKNNIDYC